MMASTSKHSDFMPYLMNRVVGRLNAPIQKMLQKRAMTLTHWRILGILDEDDELTVSELAHRTVTDQATLSRALDRLEQREMIRRLTDTSDSRLVRVSLCASGRHENREIAAYAQQVQAWAMRDLSETQKKQLQQILHLLSDSMQDDNAPQVLVAARRSYDKVPG